MDIAKLDENFDVEISLADGLKYFNPTKAPFDLEGFYWYDENQEFYRLPIVRKELFREPVRALAYCTAGGAVRFRTNSPTIAIKATLREKGQLLHMPQTSVAGFDLYEKRDEYRFLNNFRTELDSVIITGEKETGNSGEMTDYILYFPLYSGVESLKIGITEESEIAPPTPRKLEKNIVFYGSSITQGACASRPGNSYNSMVSRHFDSSFINLGFSGNAKGEIEMAELISEMEMSVFVMDYDHNAHSPEYLADTHEVFFKIFREKQPSTPVVFVSRPFTSKSSVEDTMARKNIILNTYMNAVSNGDKNVYFVDGMTFFADNLIEECSVDLCHPTDLGFYFMAEKINQILKKII